MNTLNKDEISRNFSRSAPEYDQYAVLQQCLADDLLSQLPTLDFRPQSILDLGCGTGYLTGQLAKRFPQAVIIGIDIAPGMIEAAVNKSKSQNVIFKVADAETVGFNEKSFDLIVSNASLQWMDAKIILPRVAAWLRPGGQFRFNTFGPGTLQELRQAGFRVNDFLALAQLRGIARAVFRESELEAKSISRRFKTVKELIYYLKELGAQASGTGLPTDLGAFKRYKQQFSNEGCVRATFEVISGSFMI